MKLYLLRNWIDKLNKRLTYLPLIREYDKTRQINLELIFIGCTEPILKRFSCRIDTHTVQTSRKRYKTSVCFFLLSLPQFTVPTRSILHNIIISFFWVILAKGNQTKTCMWKFTLVCMFILFPGLMPQ